MSTPKHWLDEVLDGSVCGCCGGEPDLVCSECEQHACWAGYFVCEDARTAGVLRAGGAQ